VIFNRKRKFAIRNAYEVIHRYVKEDDAIIINLDGDDWLLRDDVIDIIRSTYKKNKCDFTYGNCVIHDPGDANHEAIITDVDPDVNIRYTVDVEKRRAYRKEIFFPRHLRTWRACVYKSIPKSSFMYPNGSWLRICEDEAIFFPLLEISGKYEVIKTPLSVYNLATPHSDERIHLMERLEDEVYMRRQSPLAL
jgi:hypothetical protein